MDWKTLFFRFHGRINRAKYWLVMLVAVLALAPAGAAYFYRSELLYTLAAAGLMLAVYLSLSCTFKRLHDRGKNGAWFMIFYVLPAILERIGDAFPDRMPQSLMALVFYLPSVAISIWAFVDLGCLRGTRGPNEYGPDPLEGRA